MGAQDGYVKGRMKSGPYIYDAEEKTFVRRPERGAEYGTVPVDPMAGSLAAVGTIKKAPAAVWKKVYWSVLGGLFAVWVIAVVVSLTNEGSRKVELFKLLEGEGVLFRSELAPIP